MGHCFFLVKGKGKKTKKQKEGDDGNLNSEEANSSIHQVVFVGKINHAGQHKDGHGHQHFIRHLCLKREENKKRSGEGKGGGRRDEHERHGESHTKDTWLLFPNQERRKCQLMSTILFSYDERRKYQMMSKFLYGEIHPMKSTGPFSPN